MESTNYATEEDPLKKVEDGKETITAPSADMKKEESCKEDSRCFTLNHWRTAAFFLSLFICLIVVFAFSFVIPCPVRPQYRIYWNRTFSDAKTYNFLATEYANSDKVMDVVFVLKSPVGTKNKSCEDQGLPSPCVFVVAVDGTGGETLWERALHPKFHWAQCGMNEGVKKAWHCLVSHSNNITAVDKNTGDVIWQQHLPAGLKSSLPVLSVPDLDKDQFKDIILVASHHTQTRLVLLSGRTGAQIGSTVILQIKDITGHLYHWQRNTPYILLLTGTGIFKVSLFRVVDVANAKTDADLASQNAITNVLPVLESEIVSMVKTKPGDNSDLLVLTRKGLALVSGDTLELKWRFNSTAVPSLPSFGYFNKDNIVDVVIEEEFGNNTKRIIVLDGKSGDLLWEVYLVAAANSPRSASVLTINSFSVFMFWGSMPSNSSESGIGDRLYYMMHPLYSNVVLQCSNIQDHIVTFKATLMERGRHAAYLLLLGSEHGTDGTVVLAKQKIKQDVPHCKAVSIDARRVSDANEDIKEVFQRLRFADDL